ERDHRRVDDRGLQHASVSERLVSGPLLVLGRRRAGDRAEIAGLDDPYLRQPVAAALELGQRRIRRDDAVDPDVAFTLPALVLLDSHLRLLSRLCLAGFFSFLSSSPPPTRSPSFSAPASSAPLVLPLAPPSEMPSTTCVRSRGSSAPS